MAISNSRESDILIFLLAGFDYSFTYYWDFFIKNYLYGCRLVFYRAEAKRNRFAFFQQYLRLLTLNETYD